MLRRHHFVFISNTFPFLEEAGLERGRPRIPDSVEVELSALLKIFPLLCASLKLTTCVYFEDTCKAGAGA